MSTLALFDQVVDAGHDRDRVKRAHDFGLAAEKVQADGELLRVGTDHVLDGHGAVAVLGVSGQVNRAEAAHGKELFDAVPPMEHCARRGRQGRASALTVPFAWW